MKWDKVAAMRVMFDRRIIKETVFSLKALMPPEKA